MHDDTFNGWAVAAVAIRDSASQVSFRLRCFTVGTFYEDNARQYAYDEIARDYPPVEGWIITLATHRLSGVREVREAK